MIKEIFARLADGQWRLKRTLGNYGAAQGFATFSPQASGSLYYREEVQVINSEASSPYDASRQYIYQQNGEIIEQYFSDNKLFCILSKVANDNIWQGEHLCGSDHYKAIYNFQAADYFTLSYQVNGPQKNYIIQTEYTKLRNI